MPYTVRKRTPKGHPMHCDYCSLALPVDETGSLHEMCAEEARTDPLIDTTLRHCDLPCCNPEEDPR